MKIFKDISSFNGVREFFTGAEMVRAVLAFPNTWDIFIADEEDSYIFSGSVLTGLKTCKGIWTNFIKRRN
jgi:hypothetical protein